MKDKSGNIPYKYLPKTLSKSDRKKQLANLRKTRKLYKKHSSTYVNRPILKSYKSKPSKHVQKAMKIYGVSSMKPNKELAKKTGCSQKILRKIINKGFGAYHSSGSRPNQSKESWGYARLASAITGGPASKVDAHLLEEGCDKSNSLAYKMYKNSKF